MRAQWLRILVAVGLRVSHAQDGLPIALVFESPIYFQSLTSSLEPGLIELRACDQTTDFCASLEEPLLRRCIAVVGQPHNITLLGRLPGLRLVHSTSFMYPVLAEVPPQATVVSYMPDWRDVYGVEPIAEFVLAAVFDWNYRLRERSAEFSSCAWGADAPARCPSVRDLTSHEVLMNKTLGVLGYGKIGEAIARRSAALGLRTIATKVHGPFTPPPSPLTWLSDDNDKLLAESDFIVTALPGSVLGVINRTSLALAKKSAVVIPISAGPIDFDALYDALKKRLIGGAVIDVWPHGCWRFPEMQCGPPFGRSAEPYAGGNLQELDNVVALPGMAMRDAKFWAGSVEWVDGNLRSLAKGLPLRGIVRNSTSEVTLL